MVGKADPILAGGCVPSRRAPPVRSAGGGEGELHQLPGTLIVANHKTDFDIVLLGPTIFWSNRGRGPGGRVAFVAAERMFLPGYVSDYILHGPRWLERLVYPANLSAVLQGIRAYPIGYLRSRKLKAHLRAVLETVGDIPVQDALARPVEEVIPGAPPHAPISRVLRYRYHAALDQEWGFSVLAPEIRKSCDPGTCWR